MSERSASNPYLDVSSSPDYPKSLMVRNSVGGMVWQHYRVRSKAEADALCANSWNNGFYGSTLEDNNPYEETYPNWREECTDEIKAILVPDTEEPTDPQYWEQREAEECHEPRLEEKYL
jgi:hypothetical protein